MGLSMGHTVSALEFLQVSWDIEVERGPFKSNEPARDGPLAAIVQMAH
jgi:hypothetical protein